MISDEPDEDADHLDDEAFMRRYLGIGSGDESYGPAAALERAMPDWPPGGPKDVRLSVDSATVAWFRAKHADWRAQMQFVLRAWVLAQEQQQHTLQEAHSHTPAALALDA